VSELLAVSDRILKGFGVKVANELVIRPLSKARLTVLEFELACEKDHRVELERDDAFLLMLYLVDVEHADILADQRLTPVKRYPRGSICLVSLREGAAISIRGRFEALAVHIPTAHFLELTAEAGEPDIENFSICRGVDDPVVRNIGAALMPMFAMPDEVRDTLLPHIGLALLAHLAHRYGQSPRQHLAESGRLTVMQERRIKMYMTANLSRSITLTDIATATGFDVALLCPAFEVTTGQTIETWLLQSRIERAKSYLGKGGDNIVDVAAACGFMDDHRFEMEFKAVVGMTPQQWRARNRH
jgi:AraC-like DNA-binding protein